MGYLSTCPSLQIKLTPIQTESKNKTPTYSKWKQKIFHPVPKLRKFSGAFFLRFHLGKIWGFRWWSVGICSQPWASARWQNNRRNANNVFIPLRPVQSHVLPAHQRPVQPAGDLRAATEHIDHLGRRPLCFQNPCYLIAISTYNNNATNNTRQNIAKRKAK